MTDLAEVSLKYRYDVTNAFFSVWLTPFSVYDVFCNILSIFLCKFEFQHCFDPKHIFTFSCLWNLFCLFQTGEQFHCFKRCVFKTYQSNWILLKNHYYWYLNTKQVFIALYLIKIRRCFYLNDNRCFISIF